MTKKEKRQKGGAQDLSWKELLSKLIVIRKLQKK
jgi:hypothetical protein